MDEYIKKADAVDVCMKYCPDDDGSCSMYGEDLRSMLDEIECLSEENVAPIVYGEWIYKYDHWICSNCGYAAPIDCDISSGNCDLNQWKSNYCPKCGAKMAVEKDSII